MAPRLVLGFLVVLVLVGLVVADDASTTTVKPVPCKDSNDLICYSQNAAGYCTSARYSVAEKKALCAKTCKLCNVQVPTPEPPPVCPTDAKLISIFGTPQCVRIRKRKQH